MLYCVSAACRHWRREHIRRQVPGRELHAEAQAAWVLEHGQLRQGHQRQVVTAAALLHLRLRTEGAELPAYRQSCMLL